jgi:hypothetical protein
MGDEFPVAGAVLNMIEIFADFFNPERISNRNDGICDFLRTEVQVVYGTSCIDDQFRGFYAVH